VPASGLRGNCNGRFAFHSTWTERKRNPAPARSGSDYRSRHQSPDLGARTLILRVSKPRHRTKRPERRRRCGLALSRLGH
jgi:hypothetical protein